LAENVSISADNRHSAPRWLPKPEPVLSQPEPDDPARQRTFLETCGIIRSAEQTFHEMPRMIVNEDKRSSGIVVPPAKIVGQGPHVSILVEFDIIDLLLWGNAYAAIQQPFPCEVQQHIFKTAVRLTDRRPRDYRSGFAYRYIVECDLSRSRKLPQDIYPRNAAPFAIKYLD
jgi:hypothetical protein